MEYKFHLYIFCNLRQVSASLQLASPVMPLREQSRTYTLSDSHAQMDRSFSLQLQKSHLHASNKEVISTT